MPKTFDKGRVAAEEIKLSRKLKNLSQLLNGFEATQRPRYLLQSIANLEQRLKSLRGATPA